MATRPADREDMRIALVTEHFTPEDVPTARVAREVALRLVAGGHDVALFAHGRGPSTFHGARVFWASRMTPVSAVREAMRLSRPDVCHLLDPHRLGLKVAEAAEQSGCPTVVTHHRDWAPGVDLQHHHPGLRDQVLHDRWARAHAPDGGRVVVGYAGPLDKRKVVSRLSAVARLPGVRLLALGEGPGTATLRGHGAKVIAQVSGVERARCLASVDVVVQPRRRETCSPVVLEALASGVPVVAFDHGTAAQVVEHEHNGLLVDTDRGAGALSRAVARVAASPDLRWSLASAARDSVSGRDWEVAVGELLDVHYAAALRPALSSRAT